MTRSIRYIFYFSIITLSLNAQTKKDTVIDKVHALNTVTITELANSKSTIDTFLLKRLSINTLSEAVNIIPGVKLSKNGSRNEPNIYIHGFDIIQSGISLNNSPINMPYDGSFDFIFKDFTISKISLSNMFSSFLDNSLSGSLELETKKPTNSMEFQNTNNLSIGNNGISKYSNGIYYGSKVKKWTIAAAVNFEKNKFAQLSSSYKKDSSQQTLKLNNSESNNINPYFFIQFSPKKSFAYSLSYFGLKADKQVPVYLGINPNIKQRFWRYPIWNMDNLTLNTQTKFSKKLIAKTTWFYNVLRNTLKSYDDDKYESQVNKYAFTSKYDDYLFGGTSNFSLIRNKKNKVELHINHQTNRHKETSGTEIVSHREGRLNIRFQDIYKITPKFSVTGCIGRNFNVLLNENDLDTSKIESKKVNRVSIAVFKAFASYKPNNHIIFLAGVNKSSRFATMKERFSYRIGKAIPNPELKPEQSINSEFKLLINYPKTKITINQYYYYTKKTIQQVDNVKDGLWQLQNTGKSSSLGVDVSLIYNISKQILFGSNYSFIEKKNITNPELIFVDIPKHQVISYLSYSKSNKISITAQYEYNSERKSTSDGIYKADAFNIFNINANYKINEYFTANIGINNIFDKLYYRTEGYPEEGRIFKASIKLNLISN